MDISLADERPKAKLLADLRISFRTGQIQSVARFDGPERPKRQPTMKTQFTFEQPHLILLLMGLKSMKDEFLKNLRNRYLDGEISEPEFNGMVETYRQLVSSVESCKDPGTVINFRSSGKGPAGQRSVQIEF